MAEWSRIVPSGGPKPVEQARRQVEELKAKVPAQRQALADAQAAIIDAEKADREKMAAELAAGREPRPNDVAVAKAREHALGVERAGEALALAVANAESALGQAACESRDQWLKTAQRREGEQRAKAREALADLKVAFDGLRQAHSTAVWLGPEGGLDFRRQPPHGRLGVVRSSAHAFKNDEPAQVVQLLAWLAEMLDPPPPPTVVEHQRAEWPRMGVPSS